WSLENLDMKTEHIFRNLLFGKMQHLEHYLNIKSCLLYTSDAADEYGIRDPEMSRGLGDVYKRQV
ncbi:hypothetical protein ACX3V1_12530, partial [Escherichia coli]